MGGLLVCVLVMMLGGLAMMLRCLIVMVGRSLVMFHDLLLGHGDVPSAGW
jgi:hypothetical protein